jgi:phosphatidylglycerol:prolipoprotein diacylglycerol transferase
VLVLYAIWKKVPVRKGMDIIAPCLMVGLAFGRIGCFLNGCCYGQEWNGPLAVTYPYHSDPYIEQVMERKIHPPQALYAPDGHGGVRLLRPEEAKNDPDLKALMSQQRSRPVHPTQLYSTVTEFLIAALLLAFMTQNRVPGRAFALMLMIEPVTRFILEMLRVEPAVLGPINLPLGPKSLVIGPMSLSMVLAIPQYVLGIILWVAFGWWHKSMDQGSPVDSELGSAPAQS